MSPRDQHRNGAEDLWGELPTVDGVRTPSRILEEQSAVLADKTKHVLTGRIAPLTDSRQDGPKEFIFDYHIDAPTLNYTFTAFRVSHPLELYPVSVSSVLGAHASTKYLAKTEKEYKRLLRELFQSHQMKNLIRSLLSLTQQPAKKRHSKHAPR